jgi:hypothetical protein
MMSSSMNYEINIMTRMNPQQNNELKELQSIGGKWSQESTGSSIFHLSNNIRIKLQSRDLVPLLKSLYSLL